MNRNLPLLLSLWLFCLLLFCGQMKAGTNSGKIETISRLKSDLQQESKRKYLYKKRAQKTKARTAALIKVASAKGSQRRNQTVPIVQFFQGLHGLFNPETGPLGKTYTMENDQCKAQ